MVILSQLNLHQLSLFPIKYKAIVNNHYQDSKTLPKMTLSHRNESQLSFFLNSNMPSLLFSIAFLFKQYLQNSLQFSYVTKLNETNIRLKYFFRNSKCRSALKPTPIIKNISQEV